MSISKAISDVQASSASAGIPPQKQAGRIREVVGDFSTFLGKRDPDVELHWEFYDDNSAGERVLSITALARDGHVLKHEFRKKVRRAATEDSLYKQLVAIDRELLTQLSMHEVRFGVRVTAGRWC